MNTLLIIILIAAAAGAVTWYLRTRRAQDAARRRKTDERLRDPFAETHGNEDLLYGLAVGDVVTYHASDYLVRGSLRYNDGGFTWAEHLISDDSTQWWLGVEDDEGISTTLWRSVALADVDGEPGARSVIHNGVTYKLDEQGEASYTSEGTTGAAAAGTAGYADYRGPDGALLSFERFGSSWEVSTGQSALPAVFNIYPRTR